MCILQVELISEKGGEILVLIENHELPGNVQIFGSENGKQFYTQYKRNFCFLMLFDDFNMSTGWYRKFVERF